MKKFIKRFLIFAFVVLLVAQFIRPDKNDNGYETVIPFENDTKPSVQVAQILKDNCYDCHSGQTQYPWYAEVAPFSYWLADHVKDGKKHFDASSWESYSAKKKDHKLEELIEMVEKGEMPLNSYTWLHGKFAESDKNLLLQWAALAKLQYKDEIEVSSN
jgi:hypothetical protein